jgi:hypothetical protein
MKCLKEGEARVCPALQRVGADPVREGAPELPREGQIEIRTVEQQECANRYGTGRCPLPSPGLQTAAAS